VTDVRYAGPPQISYRPLAEPDLPMAAVLVHAS
jgi:hypothetical protein